MTFQENEHFPQEKFKHIIIVGQGGQAKFMDNLFRTELETKFRTRPNWGAFELVRNFLKLSNSEPNSGPDRIETICSGPEFGPDF